MSTSEIHVHVDRQTVVTVGVKRERERKIMKLKLRFSKCTVIMGRDPYILSTTYTCTCTMHIVYVDEQKCNKPFDEGKISRKRQIKHEISS